MLCNQLNLSQLIPPSCNFNKDNLKKKKIYYVNCFADPIMIFPVVQVLESTSWFQSLPIPPFDNLNSYLFRATLVVFTMLVAMFIPRFSLFLSLIGSFSCTALAFILPTLFYLQLVTPTNQERKARKDKVKGYIVLAFGIAGGATSFITTLVELIKN